MKENIIGIPGPEHFWQPAMSSNYQRGGSYYSGGNRERTRRAKRERVQDIPKPAEETSSIDDINEKGPIEMSPNVIIIIVNAGCK